MRLLAACAALALHCAACGGATASSGPDPGDPAGAIKAWTAASERDDAKAAYALLAPDLQKQIPYPEFERRWKANQAERKRQQKAMGDGLADGPAATATVVLEEEKKTTLTREKKFWRFEEPLVAGGRASSPGEALKLFANALDEKNVHAVMRLFTSTRRDGIEQQLEGFTAGLRRQAGQEITILGDDRAIIEWRDGGHSYKVVLKKENGEWRIDDIDMQ